MDYYETCTIQNPVFLHATPEQRFEIINIGCQVIESLTKFGTYAPQVGNLRNEIKTLQSTVEFRDSEILKYESENSHLREREVVFQAKIDVMNDKLVEYRTRLDSVQLRVDSLETELAETKLKEHIKNYINLHGKTPSCKELMHNDEIRKCVKQIPSWKTLKKKVVHEIQNPIIIYDDDEQSIVIEDDTNWLSKGASDIVHDLVTN